MTAAPLEASAPLRVLIANEHLDRLTRIAGLVERLGHEVVSRSVSVAHVGATVARDRPDIAIVGVGESHAHALDLIAEITREASCPVIALLSAYEGTWVSEAAGRGLDAYVVDSRPAELQGAIEISLRRFAETKDLKEAVARRAADAERESLAESSRALRTIELHDRVVQGLVAVQLAQDLGREHDARRALRETLEHAKKVVSDALLELREQGHSTRDLLRGLSTSSDE